MSDDRDRLLIERLAIDNPMRLSYEVEVCVFCDPSSYMDDHAADCPWVEARRMLGKPTE
jgi:hypothetical protein